MRWREWLGELPLMLLVGAAVVLGIATTWFVLGTCASTHGGHWWCWL